MHPIAAFLLLAAAQPADEPYRARGTEPGWTLAIDARTIRYEEQSGRKLTVAAPPPKKIAAGRRYDARGLVVIVTRARCSDGMSDTQYPERVTVLIGKRQMRGCGGATALPPPPPATPAFAQGTYRIETIAGRMVFGGRPFDLTFADGTLTGSAGCNTLRGTYRIDGDRLIAGPIAITRMLCPPPLMVQERDLLRVFSAPLRIEARPGRRLTLGGRGQDSLVLVGR
jgi:heat shock protein HslJ